MADCMKLELLHADWVHHATSRWPCSASIRHGEDEENIVPITKDDDVHLFDVNDVEVVMTDANERNGLDVEDDVWNAVVARLGFGNTQPVWGYWTTDRATGTQLYSL
ncbi:hypothetical protein V6N12_000200 [Hibiscus sabdariffa]|uniref:Uncharacterized protein n=1 Tax=Hibiscus sabdariffa TaxID=183260 RepID=A0ABR2ATT8_9ROSI